MPSTFSNLLRFEKQANGENDTTWGAKLNTVIELIEDGIAGIAAVSMADANYTLTTANSASDEARMAILSVASTTLTATRDVIVPTSSKTYIVKNATTGGQSIRVKTSAGTGITIPNGRTMPVFCDGTNVVVDQDWAQLVEIVDTNLNELIKFTSTASAVNEFTVANAATGAGPTLSATGGDTNIPATVAGKGTGAVILGQATSTDVRLAADQPIADSSGNEYLKFSKTTSAVNEPTVKNAATGKMPSIVATGGDTDISLYLDGKGAGGVVAALLADGFGLIGGKITRAVGSSALTLALKTHAGNDPSATEPVLVIFPSVTSNLLDNAIVVRKITAALSFVFSSGSTGGQTSAVAGPIYGYLIDNAGVVEIAASSKFFGGKSVQSTTAEGGAGAADTITTLYSTTARSNVACICVDRWKSTQTTAGTWASATGEVQRFPFPYKKPKVTRITATGANTFTRDWDSLYGFAELWGAGASGGGSNVGQSGGGGSGPSYSAKLMDATEFTATQTVMIGTGGTTVTGNNDGVDGGQSTFGAILTAPGGLKGIQANGTANGGAAPVAGSGGDEGWRGQAGTDGFGTVAGAGSHVGRGGIGAKGGPKGGDGSSNGGASEAGENGLSKVTEYYA